MPARRTGGRDATAPPARPPSAPASHELGQPSAAASGTGSSFEAGLSRLEEIVESLESGDLPLEAALAAFEEGVGLSRRCAEQIRAAERRIEILVEQGGEWLRREVELESGEDLAQGGESSDPDELDRDD